MIDTQRVLIAGGGPVGLSLALALDRASIPCTVFERNDELPQDPRANTIHPPVLELMDEWGLFERVRARARVVDRVQYWDWQARELLAELPYGLISPDTRHPYRLHIPQWEVSEILLEQVRQSEHITLEMGCEVVGFAQAEDRSSVTVTLERPSGVETVTGGWLCGADGTGSRVRNGLGIEFEGLTWDETFLTTELDLEMMVRFADASPQDGVGLAPVAYVIDPEHWAIVMLMPSAARILLPIPSNMPTQRVLSSDFLNERIGHILGNKPDFEFRHKGLYNVHHRVAARYREGRALVLGDAAHGVVPAGGTALNCGILDAAALARAFAALRDGDENALDTWERERREEALVTVQRNASESYRVLAAHGPLDRESRDRYLREATEDHDLARAHLLRISMLEDRIGDEKFPMFSAGPEAPVPDV